MTETPAQDRARGTVVPPGAWLLLALLTALNVLNFVVRQLIPSLAPLLIADLGLTRAQIGSLIGFAFVIVYATVGLVLGVVADRWPRRRLVGGGLTIWSAMTAASGAARGYLTLAVPRVFCGLGQAALTPAALAMLGDVFPARRLGLASGIYYAGLPIGTGLSLALASWIAPRYGWRACFYVVGAAGLAALALVVLAREPSRRGSDATLTPRPTLSSLARDVWRALLERRALVLVMLGGATLTYASAAATHGVTWLVQERGFSFAAAASLSGLMAVTSGFLGNLGGGWVSDSLARRWAGGRAYSLVLLTLFFAPFSVAFFLLPAGSSPFYACWFISQASTVAYFGPVFSAVQELAPAQVRGGMVAFGLLVLNLVGVGPGSLVTGVIGDRASLTTGLLVSVGVTLAGIVPFLLAAHLSTAADTER
jgi:MFS transporter, Spinster family, sphingosine-1-phosphate transporter